MSRKDEYMTAESAAIGDEHVTDTEANYAAACDKVGERGTEILLRSVIGASDERFTDKIYAEAADKYPDFRVFATYGICRFAEKYHLSLRQADEVRRYGDSCKRHEYNRYNGISIADWEDLVRFAYGLFDGERVECAYIVYVDAHGRVIGTFKRAGAYNAVQTDPCDVDRHMPYDDSVGYYLIHNHVRPVSEPSGDDIEVAQSFYVCANNDRHRFLDALVVCNHTVYSILHKRRTRYDTHIDVFKSEDSGG